MTRRGDEMNRTVHARFICRHIGFFVFFSKAESEITPDLPDADYGGAEFPMCMRTDDTYSLDFDVKELTGNTIDDAVFNRNSKVAEQFNI